MSPPGSLRRPLRVLSGQAQPKQWGLGGECFYHFADDSIRPERRRRSRRDNHLRHLLLRDEEHPQVEEKER